jgi:hypothetical protein
MTTILNGYYYLKFENNPLYHPFESERILKKLVFFQSISFSSKFQILICVKFSPYIINLIIYVCNNQKTFYKHIT